MKFENIRVFNFEGAFRGMRNPKNSWHLSDSEFGIGTWDDAYESAKNVAGVYAMIDGEFNPDIFDNTLNWLEMNYRIHIDGDYVEYACLGKKDMKLAAALIHGGSEHRKFLRQIMVTVDITAPLYWWKEFDTYKVGTTANSTSTMHKLTAKEITLENFEIDDFHDIPYGGREFIETSLIPYLEHLRKTYVDMQELLEQADDLSEALQKQMKEDGHIYYLAFKDDEPAGYLSIQPEGEHVFHLQKIYVLPSFQGMNLGKQLFEQAIKAIKELHPAPCQMRLNVNRQNKALTFYEKMGMKVQKVCMEVVL
jgi:GNAT superfamily N-acetyltransferase